MIAAGMCMLQLFRKADSEKLPWGASGLELELEQPTGRQLSSRGERPGQAEGQGWQVPRSALPQPLDLHTPVDAPRRAYGF